MTRHVRVRLALAAVLTMGALGAAGCGGSDDAPEPELALGGSSAPSDSGSSDGDTSAIPKDPVDGQVIRGRSAAQGEEEQAVEDVWFSYWEEIARMYRTQEIDKNRLYELATDQAATGPLQYALSLADKKRDQVGGVIVASTKITITGKRAVIEGCLRNSTHDVDAKTGQAVEPVQRFLETTDVLRREGPDWRVVEEKNRSVEKCAYR